MERSQFSFNLTPTDPTAELGFEAWIDNQCVFKSAHVKEIVTVTGNLPNDNVEDEHILKFILHGKTQDHTKVNESGEIVKDAVLVVSDLTFDNIELGRVVDKWCLYYHNFNGNQEDTIERFYGTLGCNGVAELKFTTPIYLWLLEHM